VARQEMISSHNPSDNAENTFFQDRLDSQHLARIKELADRRHLAVVVITHLNKSARGDDPFDRITGSNGIFGTADSAMILDRGRGEDSAVLKITGRDIEAQDYALSWNSASCTWTVEGNARDVAQTKERQDVLDVIQAADEPIRPKDVAVALGKRPDAVRYLIGVLKKEGLVREAGYGKYAPNPPHTTHGPSSTSTPHSPHRGDDGWEL